MCPHFSQIFNQFDQKTVRQLGPLNFSLFELFCVSNRVIIATIAEWVGEKMMDFELQMTKFLKIRLLISKSKVQNLYLMIFCKTTKKFQMSGNFKRPNLVNIHLVNLIEYPNVLTIPSEIKPPLTSIFVIKSFNSDEVFSSFGKTRS